MARPSTDNPDVLCFRMAIQNEIVVCGVFILADSAFKEGRACHGRKAHTQIGTRCGKFFLRNHALHYARIYHWPARVISDLEPAPMVSRYAKKRMLTSVNPRRELFFGEPSIAGRSTEEEDLL